MSRDVLDEIELDLELAAGYGMIDVVRAPRIDVEHGVPAMV
jgi:hypothetical protein